MEDGQILRAEGRAECAHEPNMDTLTVNGGQGSVLCKHCSAEGYCDVFWTWIEQEPDE